MKTDDELEAELRYELKINQMTLMPACSEKPSLIDALANIIGLESDWLHQKICGDIKTCMQINSLPRKLSYLKDDLSLLEDYRKYPYLVNFNKITLEMVSQIYEAKITVYSIPQPQSFLSGLIVNEKGYQQDIKLGRLKNYYYEVKDSNVYNCGITMSSSSASQNLILSSSLGSQKLQSCLSSNKMMPSMKIVSSRQPSSYKKVQINDSTLQPHEQLMSPLLRKSTSMIVSHHSHHLLVSREEDEPQTKEEEEEQEQEIWKQQQLEELMIIMKEKESIDRKRQKRQEEQLLLLKQKQQNERREKEEKDEKEKKDEEDKQQLQKTIRQQQQKQKHLRQEQLRKQEKEEANKKEQNNKQTSMHNRNNLQGQQANNINNHKEKEPQLFNSNPIQPRQCQQQQENQEKNQQQLFATFSQDDQQQYSEHYNNGEQYQQQHNNNGEQYQQQQQYYSQHEMYAAYYQNYYYQQQQQQQPYLYRNNSYQQPSPPKMSASRRQNSAMSSNLSTLEIKENERYTGKLKFFDEAKNYGFIIMDADNRDIFVHCDDLQKAGISKERVKSYKQSDGSIQFSFKVMEYFGKYDKSRKAVDLTIIEDDLMPGLYSGGLPTIC